MTAWSWRGTCPAWRIHRTDAPSGGFIAQRRAEAERRDAVGAVALAIDGKNLILLCDGGDKRTQSADIERAISRWQEWQNRGKK